MTFAAKIIGPHYSRTIKCWCIRYISPFRATVLNWLGIVNFAALLTVTGPGRKFRGSSPDRGSIRPISWRHAKLRINRCLRPPRASLEEGVRVSGRNVTENSDNAYQVELHPMHRFQDGSSRPSRRSARPAARRQPAPSMRQIKASYPSQPVCGGLRKS
jgi:hypothetical protein